MKIHELLLETTDEDRAIISLSSAIYNYIQKYKDSGRIDIKVGKIGEIFDTPLNILDSVIIYIFDDDRIKDIVGKQSATGVWDGKNDVIILNKEYLTSNVMKSTITHELRHALDDYKSNFKANKSNSRYVIPKKKIHRNSDLEYLAEPAEINARFLQVLSYMVPVIKRSVKLPTDQGNKLINDSFKKALSFYRILELFPEKEKSKDYKRLVSRGANFIKKELDYAKTHDGND